MDELLIEIRPGTQSVVFPIEIPIDHIKRVHKYVGHDQGNTAPISDPVEPFEGSSHSRAARIAKNMLRIASLRKKYFNNNYFDDPSWHILLDLLVHKHEGRRVSVTDACIGSLAPGTTALRHIEMLLTKGKITKHADANDKRRFNLELSQSTYCKLVDLLNQFD